MDSQRSTKKGLIGVLGIWLTAGFALPLVNVLEQFQPTQLMVYRGYITALLALIWMLFQKEDVFRVDKYTYLIALTVPFATLGLFEGIRSWGAGPTIIIITATPVVNILIGIITGRKVGKASIVGLLMVCGGVALARWGGVFNWAGFSWSVFATIVNGIIYELFHYAKSKAIQKCFWGSIGMGTLGLVTSLHHDWTQITNEPYLSIVVFGFAFIGGFLYWLANLEAFENLEVTDASILAQVETVSVIIGAWIMLGESLAWYQSVGVAVTILGAVHLVLSLQNKTLRQFLRHLINQRQER